MLIISGLIFVDLTRTQSVFHLRHLLTLSSRRSRHRPSGSPKATCEPVWTPYLKQSLRISLSHGDRDSELDCSSPRDAQGSVGLIRLPGFGISSERPSPVDRDGLLCCG